MVKFLTFVPLLTLTVTAQKPKCRNRPLVGNRVEKSCDAHLTNGAHCRFSCPSQHSLMGPPITQCLCQGDDCNWTHGDFIPQCIAWQTTWFESSPSATENQNNEQTQQTNTEQFSVVNDAGLAGLRALVGDDAINDVNEAEKEASRSFSVEAADDTCGALSDPGNGGVWSCTNSNAESSHCTLSCPNGYKPSDNSGTDTTCTCSTEYDGPIVIELGCAWDNQNVATCVEDTDYSDSCIELSAPENGTMSCSDGFNSGTMCTFTCNDPTDLIYPAKSSKRRCKCKDGKGCFWTRTDNYCGPPPIEPECSAVDTYIDSPMNEYTSVICDDANNHGSICEWVCAADFRLNGRGRRSRCKCKRKQGIYSCEWSREFEDRHCVPAPRYYRKWHRKYNKASRTGDSAWQSELQADYDKVSVWADDELSQKYRRRRDTSLVETIEQTLHSMI